MFLEVSHARLKGRSRNAPKIFATSCVYAYSMSFGVLIRLNLAITANEPDNYDDLPRVAFCP